MILLDTHIWVLWVDDTGRLTPSQRGHITSAGVGGIGVSIISCLEVARLVEGNKIAFAVDVAVWIDAALAYSNVQLLPITPEIAVASTRLPGPFHKDQADRILVATARAMNIPILTADSKILDYPHATRLV